MQVVNVSNFRNDLFSYVTQALDFGEPIFVKTRKGIAVFLNGEDYLGLAATAELQSEPGMREKLVEGMNARPEDCVLQEACKIIAGHYRK